VANLAGEADADAASRVRLLQGDCADVAQWAAGGALSECTCAYLDNLLFDAALNARLKERLESCASMQRVAAHLQWPNGLDGFGDPVEVRCETSWSANSAQGSPVYVYERDSSSKPSWLTGELEGALIALALAVVSVSVSDLMAGGA
jgi:hypothetical protein